MIFITFLSILFGIVNGLHFNGGTITWAPVNPYDNSSSVIITITQSYSWSYPTISCLSDVPISTSGWSGVNDNLTCVVDCTTDGNYSAHPIDILTDCTSSSTSLGMMTSQRSVNVTLLADAHFSVAYQGVAWRALGYPAVGGLDWSILCSIDLQKRPDGFINTPPVTSIVSPQYAIVNQTTQIKIPVSDVNPTDDIRCRWSIFQQGYRRRRSYESDNENLFHSPHDIYKKVGDDEENYIRFRVKRAGTAPTGGTSPTAPTGGTSPTAPTGGTYATATGTKITTITTITTTTTTTTTTITKTTRTTVTTTTDLSTSETQGTKKSTSSFIHRQAIDECGGICNTTVAPDDTTLSNCTLTFTGLVPGAWYAIAIQIEDFINSTSTKPMSSVPVQILIHILPTPLCSVLPTFSPLADCLDVQVNVPVTFSLYVNNSCDPSDSNITDIIVTKAISGLTLGPLNLSPSGYFVFVTLTWTPQSNQIGSQELCTIAFTSERAQSNEYCITFNVQTAPACTTTTSTSTSTSTTITTVTTSTATTSTATTTTKPASKKIDWLLLLTSSLLALLLLLCWCCCLRYWLCGPGARRRRQKYAKEEEERKMQYILLKNDTSRTSMNTVDSRITLDKTPHIEKDMNETRINRWNKPMKIGIANIKARVQNKHHSENQDNQYSSTTVTKVKKETGSSQNNHQQNSTVRWSKSTHDPSVTLSLPTHQKSNYLNQNVVVKKLSRSSLQT